MIKPQTSSIGNRCMWGSWYNTNALEPAPTFKQVLEKILEETPNEILNKTVLDSKYINNHKSNSFTVVYKEPVPSYEDPLAQRGFVSWKLIYEI